MSKEMKDTKEVKELVQGTVLDRLTKYNLEKQKKSKETYEGLVYETKGYGEVIVINYVTNKEVYVVFKNTGTVVCTRTGNLSKGAVRDYMLPTVYGVGITGNEVTKHNGEHTPTYKLWHSVIQRCYSEKVKLKHKAYENCQASDYFKYYPNFKEWCNKQIGFNCLDEKGERFHLDKDLLSDGAKTYSEDNCCFIPREINTAITKVYLESKASRTGVTFYGGKFVSRVSKFNICITLGKFDTEQEAFYTYKQAKEAYIKELANKWKDKIDSRVYNALMSYEIETTI